MAHFLIINTGGTIGMTEGLHGLEPHAGEIEKAMNDQPALSAWKDHSLTWHHWQPLLDSSDLRPSHWYELKNLILETKEIDGVLIIHGTDTLSYTAAALSFLLSGYNKPVVITGSMLPISAANTDAIENLQSSLAALIAARPEVVVAIGKNIFPGSRVTKSSTASFDSFETPNWSQTNWNENFEHNSLTVLKAWRPAAIGVLTLYPGMPMDGLMSMVDRFYKAIVINAFGNGNAADDNAFRRILKRAQEKKIPVFVRSQCLEGQVNFALYASGVVFDEHGAIGCGTMPFEAVITKLQILGSEFDRSEDIIHGFKRPVSREWQ